jgi:hypothetical protein
MVGQIAMVGSGSPFASYMYDANGSRVRKDNSDGTWTKYLDFAGQSMAERHYDGSQVAVNDYIYADGKKADGKKIAKTENYETRMVELCNRANCRLQLSNFQ